MTKLGRHRGGWKRRGMLMKQWACGNFADFVTVHIDDPETKKLLDVCTYVLHTNMADKANRKAK